MCHYGYVGNKEAMIQTMAALCVSVENWNFLVSTVSREEERRARMCV